MSHSDLLSQNLHVNKIPGDSEEHCTEGSLGNPSLERLEGEHSRQGEARAWPAGRAYRHVKEFLDWTGGGHISAVEGGSVRLTGSLILRMSLPFRKLDRGGPGGERDEVVLSSGHAMRTAH